MTKGKPRSFSTFDLSFIFFKIRETRCPNTRRSWMRRARIALAKLENLTDQDRHEIICVWSRSNACQIASEAMQKVLPRLPQHDDRKTLKSRCFLRQRFDANGSRIKKPSMRGLAVNDPIFNADYSADRINRPLENVPLRPAYCTLNHGAFLFADPRAQEYIYPYSYRDNDARYRQCDSRTYLPRQRANVQALIPSTKRKLQLVCSYQPPDTAHEIGYIITNKPASRNTAQSLDLAQI